MSEEQQNIEEEKQKIKEQSKKWARIIQNSNCSQQIKEKIIGVLQRGMQQEKKFYDFELFIDDNLTQEEIDIFIGKEDPIQQPQQQQQMIQMGKQQQQYQNSHIQNSQMSSNQQMSYTQGKNIINNNMNHASQPQQNYPRNQPSNQPQYEKQQQHQYPRQNIPQNQISQPSQQKKQNLQHIQESILANLKEFKVSEEKIKSIQNGITYYFLKNEHNFNMEQFYSNFSYEDRYLMQKPEHITNIIHLSQVDKSHLRTLALASHYLKTYKSETYNKDMIMESYDIYFKQQTDANNSKEKWEEYTHSLSNAYVRCYCKTGDEFFRYVQSEIFNKFERNLVIIIENHLKNRQYQDQIKIQIDQIKILHHTKNVRELLLSQSREILKKMYNENIVDFGKYVQQIKYTFTWKLYIIEYKYPSEKFESASQVTPEIQKEVIDIIENYKYDNTIKGLVGMSDEMKKKIQFYYLVQSYMDHFITQKREGIKQQSEKDQFRQNQSIGERIIQQYVFNQEKLFETFQKVPFYNDFISKLKQKCFPPSSSQDNLINKQTPVQENPTKIVDKSEEFKNQNVDYKKTADKQSVKTNFQEEEPKANNQKTNIEEQPPQEQHTPKPSVSEYTIDIKIPEISLSDKEKINVENCIKLINKENFWKRIEKNVGEFNDKNKIMEPKLLEYVKSMMINQIIQSFKSYMVEVSKNIICNNSIEANGDEFKRYKKQKEGVQYYGQPFQNQEIQVNEKDKKLKDAQVQLYKVKQVDKCERYNSNIQMDIEENNTLEQLVKHNKILSEFNSVLQKKDRKGHDGHYEIQRQFLVNIGQKRSFACMIDKYQQKDLQGDTKLEKVKQGDEIKKKIPKEITHKSVITQLEQDTDNRIRNIIILQQAYLNVQKKD